MDRSALPPALQDRLLGPLHVEALLLADEARAYFDAAGRHERGRLEPVARVAFSCESLKLTTRLMHVLGWLLGQRAGDAGEMGARSSAARPLAEAPASSDDVLAMLPETARSLIEASIDLHRRVARLVPAPEAAIASPARSMLARLSAAF
ncbi:DUF1465 family protein [Sphingomonas sp. ac-8]|uniref:DUF1465 family protein n=1 Tax=Sphingomonas sp. ac-8 TaxID=3242977 RepID=UPI003A809F29